MYFSCSGSLITFGNVVYVLLFGWWISLLYFLVGLLMFCSIAGFPYGMFDIFKFFAIVFIISSFQFYYDGVAFPESVLSCFVIGKLCLQLSGYFLWPFGKALKKVRNARNHTVEAFIWAFQWLRTDSFEKAYAIHSVITDIRCHESNFTEALT